MSQKYPVDDRHEKRLNYEADAMKIIPDKCFSALLYEFGEVQWLSPVTLEEYADEARRRAQGLYGIELVKHAQYDPNHILASTPNWEKIRETRDLLYWSCFGTSDDDLFELLEYETPDDMFDAVEAEFTHHEILTDYPLERTKEYVEVDQ